MSAFLFWHPFFLYKNVFYLSGWIGSYIHGALLTNFQPDFLNPSSWIQEFASLLALVLLIVTEDGVNLFSIILYIFNIINKLILHPYTCNFLSNFKKCNLLSSAVWKKFLWMYIQVKLKTSEEEKKTVETRLQVVEKDLATIRERESKLSSEKVMVILYISWLTSGINL